VFECFISVSDRAITNAVQSLEKVKKMCFRGVVLEYRSNLVLRGAVPVPYET